MTVALLAAGAVWWAHRRVGAGEPAFAVSAGAVPAGLSPATAGSAAPVPPAAVASPAPTGSPAPASALVRAPASATPATRPPSPAKDKARVNTSGRDLALGGVATASSLERSDLSARNAVDGDPATRWSSGFSDPQWLRVDLGGRWQLSEIRLGWENAHATAYRLEVSTDGTTWRPVYRTTNGQGGEVVVELAKVPARYVRMYGTQRSTAYGYSLLELEVR